MSINGDDNEAIVSLQEVIDEEEYLDNAAQCLFGNIDDEKCSYPQGHIKRQPLYSCLTCAKGLNSGPAGVCLACSLQCHEEHECVELYTKRNFRCDCGNAKFNNGLNCKLEPSKDTINELNVYNQNFDGLYCTCHRPYPDPENEDEGTMIQCIICEDWFHAEHANIDTELEFEELACASCVEKMPFIHCYGISSDAELTEKNHDDVGPAKMCKKPVLKNSACSKSVLLPADWRSVLCRCEDCLKEYRALHCEFLLDEEDSLEAYERKAKSAPVDSDLENVVSSSNGPAPSFTEELCMKVLQKFDRVQQVEMMHEFNNMSSELSQFLRKFAAQDQVVKQSDIYEFFEQLQSKKRMRLNETCDYSST